MLNVTHHNTTESRPYHFVTEASLLGLPPGSFPELLPTQLGNQLPFEFQRFERTAGELVAACYFQRNGCVTLAVLND